MAVSAIESNAVSFELVLILGKPHRVASPEPRRFIVLQKGDGFAPRAAVRRKAPAAKKVPSGTKANDG